VSKSAKVVLGRVVQIDLVSTFLGLMDPAEIPSILEPLGLLSRSESELLWDELEAKRDVWPWLQPRL